MDIVTLASYIVVGFFVITIIGVLVGGKTFGYGDKYSIKKVYDNYDATYFRYVCEYKNDKGVE